MVGTIKPRGAIANRLVAFLLPIRDDGACFVLDKHSNIVKIEKCDYERLSKEGVPLYEGRIKKSGYYKL